MRSRPEWNKTDKPDAYPPQWVFERKFAQAHERCEGPCGRKLSARDRWKLDHIIRLRDGGENRESNLQVLCVWCEAIKTAAENKRGARGARNFAKHHKTKQRKPWPLQDRFKRKVSGEVVKRS